jgi:predicted dehydrogenase
MAKKKRMLMFGGSGMAGGWINRLTENFGNRVEIVGLVDVLPEVLIKQGQALGLDGDHLFQSTEEAIENCEADFAGVAVPPQFHKEAVIAALEAGMPVITEKPIADTLESAMEMVAAADSTGLPCSVIQNYRHEPNKQELVRIREEGRLGRLQHILGRYACDYRKPGSWGKDWRHTMDFGLLFEGSVHHFDMLRFLSGGDCETLVGFGWNPDWSSFKHFSSGMYLMKMNNGVHTFYEGNSTAAGITNCWHNEYYRAEFEEGSVEVWGTDQVSITRVGQEPETYTAPALEWDNHDHLFVEFLDWLDGGPASATCIQDNIKSFAMVIAAMQTTLDGQPKQISDLIG